MRILHMNVLWASEWSVVREKSLSFNKDTRMRRVLLVSGEVYKDHRMNNYASGIEADCTTKSFS